MLQYFLILIKIKSLLCLRQGVFRSGQVLEHNKAITGDILQMCSLLFMNTISIQGKYTCIESLRIILIHVFNRPGKTNQKSIKKWNRCYHLPLFLRGSLRRSSLLLVLGIGSLLLLSGCSFLLGGGRHRF